jgi:proline racemase
MRFEKMITAVDSHTEGMPTRVVTSGFGPVPGKTMFEKKHYVEEHLDHLRTLLMFEPRGHSSMSGSVILPPTDPGADLGVVFIEVSGCLPMCGHGTIGTCTVAIETGLVRAVEPITHLKLDTPAGRVLAEATVQNGRVKKVKIQNVPAFLYRRDAQVDVPGFGRLTLDIAFGGNFYSILPAEAVGLTLERKKARALIDAGMKVMEAVETQIPLQHPLNPGIKEIKHTMFTGPADVEGAHAKNTVVVYPGTLDRSPCGTGTSARMAQLFERKKLGLNQDFVHESIIGTLFSGQLIEQVQLTSEITAFLPTIEGRAWISGLHQFVLDPDDPFPAGFLIDHVPPQRE